ncbi:hemerythrin domain-containing protein [Nocardia sp. NBC_01327]|uniref:hemerythrin domain-containing protein n=1 Tax=Nocardia sp. NBC_01327 TaxID=2903593 RepID=UPI002E0E5D26|nr:hemerythrin domain-containing protein [Nocardia sp. NBC_01327]
MPLSSVANLPRGHRTMLLAHRAMVRDLGRIERTARELAVAPDPVRAKALGGYADKLALVIHHHHEGEDEFLWPRLRDAGADRQALETLIAEHAALTDLLDDWHDSLANLSTDSATATRLAELTSAVRDQLAGHTADEERELLGRLAPSLDEQTWKAFETHMRTTAPLWTLRFMPAWLLSAASPDDLVGVPALPLARLFSGRLQRTQRAAFGTHY